MFLAPERTPTSSNLLDPSGLSERSNNYLFIRGLLDKSVSAPRVPPPPLKETIPWLRKQNPSVRQRQSLEPSQPAITAREEGCELRAAFPGLLFRPPGR